MSMLIQLQAGHADNLDNHVKDSLVTMKKTYRQSFSKGLLEITFRDDCDVSDFASLSMEKVR